MGENDRPQGVGEEATAQGPGVGEEPTAPAEGVATTEPTAGEETPQDSPRDAINLDDVPEFRRWKASYDRRMAQIEQRAQEAEQRAAEAASRLEELELRDLPPDEQAARYKTMLAQQRAQAEEERAAQERAQALSQEAMQLLGDLGLDPDTPGLEWGDSATPENLARLYASAARVVATRQAQQSQQKAEDEEAQTREARINALRDAGVTRTSVATSGAPPESNPIADVRDPEELLRLGIEQELRKKEGRPKPRG